MSYRDPAGFFCTADMLLGLILKNPDIDLEKDKSSAALCVEEIYRGCPIVTGWEGIYIWPFNSREKTIIEFGKENKITEQAWLEAIEKRLRNG